MNRYIYIVCTCKGSLYERGSSLKSLSVKVSFFHFSPFFTVIAYNIIAYSADILWFIDKKRLCIVYLISELMSKHIGLQYSTYTLISSRNKKLYWAGLLWQIHNIQGELQQAATSQPLQAVFNLEYLIIKSLF